LIAGIYLLFVFNKLFKKLIVKSSEKWKIDRNIVRQLRRFIMLALFILLGNLWLKLAGSFLIRIFNDDIFSINEVAITSGIIVYSLLILYGLSIGIRFLEVVYTRHVLSRGLNMG
jgi:Na+-driven multidrug efflux pump